jgi:hypothetical protein
MDSMKLTAVFMKVAEGYAAFVEELPGANTQGSTLEPLSSKNCRVRILRGLPSKRRERTFKKL